MNRLPFQRTGRFYRGNLHTHSNVSDGAISPDEVVNAYRENGYDFIAITDHFREQFGYPVTDTTGHRSENFTTLLGAELHAPALENGQNWHIVALGLPLDFAPPGDQESAPELAARAANSDAFIGIAHPAWYSLSLNDARSIEVAHAIEIYNQTCAMANDRGDSWYVADMLLAEGRRYSAFGSDDAHFRSERPDAFAAWVMVRADRLDPDSILSALKAGHYYTSQGPQIHDISIDENLEFITIRTSPARSVFVSGRANLTTSRHGIGMTNVCLPLEQFRNDYFRVTMMDGNGKRAWSNPIWLDGQGD